MSHYYYRKAYTPDVKSLLAESLNFRDPPQAFLLLRQPRTVAAAESGFAKVRANGALVTVGGPDTNTADSTHIGPGWYAVQFFGNYPSSINADNVVVNTTAVSADGAYGVSNAVVATADANQITVVVFTWKSSNTDMTVDNSFFITVFTTPDPMEAGHQTQAQSDPR